MSYNSLITFFFQLLIPIAIVFLRFNRRDHFARRLVGFGALLCALAAAYYSPTAIPFLPEWLNYYLYYMVGYAFAFLYVWLCFDMPFLVLTFFVLQAFIVQNFSHHLFELVVRAMGVPVGVEYGKVEYLFILTAIYCVVYAVYYFVLVRWLKLREVSTVPKSSIAVALGFFLVMIGLGIYVRHISMEMQSSLTIAIGYELYSLILDFFILCLHFGVFNIGKLQESNEQFERRIEQESRYYELARSTIQEVNMRCHDLKHQISGLRHMGEGEKDSVITELENSLLVYGSLVETGNEALDYILTEKGLYCANNQINFTVIANGKLLAHLSYNDIYVLFGNALDNAIEGVLKIDDPKRRIISLKIQERGGMAHVHLENVCNGMPKLAHGLPQTTKPGSGHGYGVRSIKYIVEKYGGNFTVSAEENLFSLDLLIPLPKEQP